MRFRITLLALAVAALALGSCTKKHPVAPVVVAPQGPAADSPAGAVKRFAWSWVNRDAAAYSALLTSDFRFGFAIGDSAGNAYREVPWGYEDEHIATGHLFSGGGSRPPATDILFTIDANPVALSDLRPGMNPRWHKYVRTHLNCKLTVEQGGTPSVSSVQGYALFYLVRGDSAEFSPERRAMGMRPDSTVWYVSRWEDESISGGAPAFNPMPTRNTTLGYIKTLYRW